MNIVFWLIGTLIVVLGPIILIHELGHFTFARLAGARVEEFGLGFPPRLLKLWRSKGYLEIGSTRVVIPAGFRLPSRPVYDTKQNIDPGKSEDFEPELILQPRSVPKTRLEAGAWVDVIAQQHDDGTYLLRRMTVLDPAEDDLTIKHEHVDEGVHMRGELTILEPGTLYSLNWLPIGGFVKMTGEEDPSDPRSLAAQPKRWRVAVLAGGAAFNIIAALLLLVGAYTTGFPDKWLVEITRVEPETAAEEAGLQPADIILAVSGERIEGGLAHLHNIIRAAPEQTLELDILRGDETLTITATPRRTSEGYGFLGIRMAPWPDRSAVQRYRLPEALSASINDTAAAILMTVQVPAMLVQGDITPQEARPASMVGISEILAISLQQSIEWGLAFPVLQTASLISLALGLTNLLPLPALDGGRILFVLIEAVRGRRISPNREAMFHFVGLVIMVGLMVLVMLQDIINPIIPWSWLVK
ncbi:MAG: site-2 protease family protein [Chloroflexota bacterium]|nr:site-2 protease family protein [Chloroflexota bacterium]